MCYKWLCNGYTNSTRTVDMIIPKPFLRVAMDVLRTNITLKPADESITLLGTVTYPLPAGTVESMILLFALVGLYVRSLDNILQLLIWVNFQTKSTFQRELRNIGNLPVSVQLSSAKKNGISSRTNLAGEAGKVYGLCNPKKMNGCPLKRNHFKGRVIFQPSIFRAYASFHGGRKGFYLKNCKLHTK